MILLTGGAYQGKREYAGREFGIRPEEWLDGSACSREELFSCRAVFDFHKTILRGMRENWDLQSLPDELAAENPDILIVTNELGCGIVPLDEEERAWRETAGRLTEQLAARACTVVRVLCGLGMVLKAPAAGNGTVR